MWVVMLFFFFFVSYIHLQYQNEIKNRGKKRIPSGRIEWFSPVLWYGGKNLINLFWQECFHSDLFNIFLSDWIWIFFFTNFASSSSSKWWLDLNFDSKFIEFSLHKLKNVETTTITEQKIMMENGMKKSCQKQKKNWSLEGVTNKKKLENKCKISTKKTMIETIKRYG